MIKKYFWIIPFASFIAGYILIQFLVTTKELHVPNLMGKSLQEACELLSEQNINIRILARKEDPDLPPHTIISQTPQPNEKIKPHQAVYCVLTAQAQTSRAPELVNKSVTQIKDELAKLGIHANVHLVPSPYPAHTCIAQSPRPGESIEQNTIMVYCASPSKKPIVWPDFTQKPLGIVKEALEAAHIEAQVLHSRHAISDESIVVDQRPRAGTILTLDEAKPMNVQLSVE